MKLVKRLSRARLGCHTLHSGTDGMKFKEKPERKQNFLTLILLVCSLSRKIIIKWVETGIQNQVSLNRKTALLKKKKKKDYTLRICTVCSGEDQTEKRGSDGVK